MKSLISLLALTASATLSLPVQAALFTFQSGSSLVAGNSLGGTVTYEGWDNLTTARINNNPTTVGDNTTRPYGYHNLANAWTGPAIVSNLGSGTSSLSKSGGYGYIAGGSLHQGASTGAVIAGGNFTLSSSAILGLQTLLFQIQATDNAGSVFDTLPTLTIGTSTLSANYFSGIYATETTTGMGGAQNKNSYAFQWDLTGLTINQGDALTVNWTGIANSGIYQLQLNQGTSFAQVVPEPSSALLGAAALGFTLIRRRRA